MNTEETTTVEVDQAERNGRAWLKNIHEMVKGLDEDNPNREDVQESIAQSVLSVCVRDSSWHLPGNTDFEPNEFEILLSTGGPALRIFGNLNEYNEPEDVELQKQDWFKPWTRMELSQEDEDAVQKFAEQFYFGDT